MGLIFCTFLFWTVTLQNILQIFKHAGTFSQNTSTHKNTPWLDHDLNPGTPDPDSEDALMT